MRLILINLIFSINLSFIIGVNRIAYNGLYSKELKEEFSIRLSSSTKQPIWSFNASYPVFSVAISSDGNYITAGTGTVAMDDDAYVYLFNKVSSAPLWTYKAGSDVRSVAISSDGSYITSGSADKNVYLFDKSSSNPLWNYTAFNSVWPVAISSDGNYIAAASDYVYLFEKSSSTPLWNYQTGGNIYSVAISSDGNYIAAGGWDDYNVYLFSNEIPPNNGGFEIPFSNYYLIFTIVALISLIIVVRKKKLRLPL